MSGHSPAPWSTNSKARYVFSADGTAVANCGLNVGDEAREANARLIAAAPELFEAVQSLVYLVKESGFRSGLTEEALDAALGSGIAAIAKARGGA